ncbi:EamA family transporter [Nocardia sp. NPDC003345]
MGLGLIAQGWQGARPDPVGIAAGLGAAVCSAGFFLLGEHGARRHDPFGMTAAGLLLGAMVMAVVAAPWTLPFDLFPAVATLGGLQVPVWLVLLVLAVVGTALPYLAGLWALRELPAPLAGALGLLEPIVAAALAWMLLGQALRPAQLAGVALLLLCAVLVQRGMP